MPAAIGIECSAVQQLSRAKVHHIDCWSGAAFLSEVRATARLVRFVATGPHLRAAVTALHGLRTGSFGRARCRGCEGNSSDLPWARAHVKHPDASDFRAAWAPARLILYLLTEESNARCGRRWPPELLQSVGTLVGLDAPLGFGALLGEHSAVLPVSPEATECESAAWTPLGGGRGFTSARRGRLGVGWLETP